MQLLPASLWRYRRCHSLFPQASAALDVLILCPQPPSLIEVILCRIAATFRARGRRVALWRVSRHGGSERVPIETAGKPLSRPWGRNHWVSGGRIQYKNK
jgi:hypothetical protein